MTIKAPGWMSTCLNALLKSGMYLGLRATLVCSRKILCAHHSPARRRGSPVLCCCCDKDGTLHRPCMKLPRTKICKVLSHAHVSCFTRTAASLKDCRQRQHEGCKGCPPCVIAVAKHPTYGRAVPDTVTTPGCIQEANSKPLHFGVSGS